MIVTPGEGLLVSMTTLLVVESGQDEEIDFENRDFRLHSAWGKVKAGLHLESSSRGGEMGSLEM